MYGFFLLYDLKTGINLFSFKCVFSFDYYCKVLKCFKKLSIFILCHLLVYTCKFSNNLHSRYLIQISKYTHDQTFYYILRNAKYLFLVQMTQMEFNTRCTYLANIIQYLTL